MGGQIGSKRTTLLVVLIAVWVVALVVAGAWLFVHFRGGSAPQAARFEAPPVLTQKVDLTLEDGERLVPFDSALMLRGSGVEVLRIRKANADRLVALDSLDHSTHPLWQAGVSSDVSCGLAAQSVRCGEKSFNLITGAETVVVASSQSEHAAQPGEDATQPNEDGDQVVTQPNEDADEDAAQPDEDAAQPDGDADDGVKASTARHVVVGPDAQEGVPLSADGQGSVVWEGQPVSGVSVQPDVNVSGLQAGDVWLICDGSTIYAVEGGKPVWSQQLPEGSAQINGFDTSDPGWDSNGAQVVWAQPDGLVGFNVADGTQAWKLETPIKQAAVRGGQALIATEDTVGMLTFPDGTNQSESGARSGTTQAQGPSFDQLKNATLELPQDCAAVVTNPSGESEVTNGEPVSIEFVNGEGQGLPPEVQDLNTHASLRESKSTTLSGQPVTVVMLDCYGGGASAASNLEVFGFYDADLALVTSFAPRSDGDNVGGVWSYFYVDQWDVSGRVLTYLTSPFALTGEPRCNGCGGSGSATATMVWDGDQFALTRSVWHTPEGDQLHFKTLEGERPAVPNVNDTDPVTYEYYQYSSSELGFNDSDYPTFDGVTSVDEILDGAGPWFDQALADWLQNQTNGCLAAGPYDFPVSCSTSVKAYRSDGWASVQLIEAWAVMHFVDGEWTVVLGGQAPPMCADLVEAGVPREFNSGSYNNHCFPLSGGFDGVPYTGPDGDYD